MGTEKIVNKGHPGLNTKNISFKIWRLGSTHIAYARTSSEEERLLHRRKMR